MPKLCRYLPRAIISLYFIILQHNNMCIHILFGIMCVIILALFPIHWRYPNWGQIGNESERIYSGGQGYWSYLWGLRGKRSEKDVMGGGGRGGGGVGRGRSREAEGERSRHPEGGYPHLRVNMTFTSHASTSKKNKFTIRHLVSEAYHNPTPYPVNGTLHRKIFTPVHFYFLENW